MNGQESLGLARRLERSHLPFTLPRRLVRDLGSIVSVLAGVVDDGRHDLAVSGTVASQLVGDQPPGRATLSLQQPAEESFSGFSITARLDKDIEHITILIHRAPKVVAFALYLCEDFVQVPRVTETTLPTLQSTSIFRPELDTPKSDRFVRDPDAALSEQIFDISKAHAESLSRPGESHPQPLAERYVNLSTHTAPIRRTHLVLSSSAARANGCYGSVPAHSTGSERGGAGHGVSSKWQRVRRAAAVRHGLRGRHDDTAARRGSAWSEQMPSDGGERSGEPHGRDGERRG